MADDLLGDILRQTTGEAPARPERIGDVLGQAVSRPARAPTGAAPPDLGGLAQLDGAGAAAFLRYLPADLVIPLLAHAPVAVQNRLVGAMDADARAWLASQNDEIEAVTPERHAAAATKAVAVLEKLRAEGRLTAAQGSGPRGQGSGPPVQVAASFAVAGGEAPVISEQRPAASERQPAAEPLVGLLAQLVDAARGRRPGELRQLADGLDHPVLAQGLRLVADGGEPHAIDAAMRSLAADHLAAEEHRLDLIRRAVLAIRFDA